MRWEGTEQTSACGLRTSTIGQAITLRGADSLGAAGSAPRGPPAPPAPKADPPTDVSTKAAMRIGSEYPAAELRLVMQYRQPQTEHSRRGCCRKGGGQGKPEISGSSGDRAGRDADDINDAKCMAAHEQAISQHRAGQRDPSRPSKGAEAKINRKRRKKHQGCVGPHFEGKKFQRPHFEKNERADRRKRGHLAEITPDQQIQDP